MSARAARRGARRRFLLAAAAVLARPRAVLGRGAKVYRIGVLGSTSPKVHGPFVASFLKALRERGYAEGQNLAVELRWADGDYGRLPALAAELVRLKVDLLLTHGTPGSRAAKAATSTIPVVVAVVGDAVTTGLVQSLARPGGNVTGLSFSLPEVNAKRLELLTEAFPGLRRVSVLMNSSNVGNVVTFDAMVRIAGTLGVDIVQVLAASVDEFEGAFRQIVRSGAEAVSIYEDALFIAEAARLGALAQRHRLRSIGFREYAEAGGLLGFGVNFADAWRRAAGFAERIFKGANPAGLPMEEPSKFDTVVNLRAARELRVTVSRKVLVRAETVGER